MFFKKKKSFNDKESWLIVGLGNPGSRYVRTWHNCGYMALERLAAHLRVRVNKARFKGAYGQVDYKGKRLILLKPETYMNLSGESVQAAMRYFNVSPEHLLVFYDDIDLKLGQLRLRGQGGAGTHNGMKSLLQHLGGGNFARLRIGIGPVPPGRELVDFVLDNIPKSAEDTLTASLALAEQAALLFIDEGLEAAMRLVN